MAKATGVLSTCM